MEIREADLPGIGRKYCIRTRAGEQLTIVVHNDERREVYHMEEKGEGTLSVVTLDDEESRTVSAILAGITYKPKALEAQEVLLDDLVIEWLRLDSTSWFIGRSIGELGIRELTGAAIIAVVERDKHKVFNPGPEYVFTAGSTLVASAERCQFKALQRLMNNMDTSHVKK
ncbi:cation:proton antiporter regulatory subunit [Paenibacillus albidus]|uniref:cation:proton antiporter regulatory subunit n=1 Tax=Paenibacillus albidus TaxID=2041023 RepID=UPI001BE6FDA1|nr:cation:proton antiporter regulatory subunit [Paenibacillus albidus]MBT2292118.1 cation:proton antiporter regulatory subunit [Paenibacillus albidus]